MQRAQGTMEYLLIFGIVIVISLVVVGLMASQLDPTGSVSQSSNKIDTLTKTIALTESVIEPNDGNFVMRLLNNTGTNVTITNVKVGDVNVIFSQDLTQGEAQLFRIDSSLTCTQGTNVSETVTVTYTTPNGLVKTESYSGKIIFECTNYNIVENNLASPITAPSAPTNVVAVAGDGQATITFSAPTSDGGSTITGYTVTSSNGGTDANAGSTSLTHTVTGLLGAPSYTFTVTATNAIGTSTASTASSEIIPTAYFVSDWNTASTSSGPAQAPK